MYDLSKAEVYKTALVSSLNGNDIENRDIMARVEADAATIERAARTLSLMFYDSKIPGELFKYSEFLYELIHDFKDGTLLKN